MKIIAICSHPTLGKVYLWGNDKMQYNIGTTSTTYMKFDGFLLEEVLEKIKEKGFVPYSRSSSAG